MCHCHDDDDVCSTHIPVSCWSDWSFGGWFEEAESEVLQGPVDEHDRYDSSWGEMVGHSFFCTYNRGKKMPNTQHVINKYCEQRVFFCPPFWL